MSVSGNTLQWTGAGSTAWDDPANWNLGLAPANGDSLVFQGTVNTTVFDTSASLTLDTLSFAASSGQFFVNVLGDLLFGGPGIVNDTCSPQKLRPPPCPRSRLARTEERGTMRPW